MTRLFTTYGGSRVELGSRVGAETEGASSGSDWRLGRESKEKLDFLSERESECDAEKRGWTTMTR